MPYIMRIKRSNEPGAIPATLAYGELAYNFADGLLYIGGPDGNAVQIAAGGQTVTPPPPPEPDPRADDGFTARGIRRRLLPFEG